jgi:hypothetical protein
MCQLDEGLDSIQRYGGIRVHKPVIAHFHEPGVQHMLQEPPHKLQDIDSGCKNQPAFEQSGYSPASAGLSALAHSGKLQGSHGFFVIVFHHSALLSVEGLYWMGVQFREIWQRIGSLATYRDFNFGRILKTALFLPRSGLLEPSVELTGRNRRGYRYQGVMDSPALDSDIFNGVWVWELPF